MCLTGSQSFANVARLQRTCEFEFETRHDTCQPPPSLKVRKRLVCCRRRHKTDPFYIHKSDLGVVEMAHLATTTRTLLRRAATLERAFPVKLPSQQQPQHRLLQSRTMPSSDEKASVLFMGALIGIPAVLLYTDYVRMREKVEIIGGRLQRASSRWL
jgi:hypothetical protein